jgi:hypothetical protein
VEDISHVSSCSGDLTCQATGRMNGSSSYRLDIRRSAGVRSCWWVHPSRVLINADIRFSNTRERERVAGPQASVSDFL